MGASEHGKLPYNLQICNIDFVCWFVFLYFSHRLVAEESDSDSDEDLEGGVRHDLMMADEKVRVETSWWHPRVTYSLNPLLSWWNIGLQLVLATWPCKPSLLQLCHSRAPAGVTWSPSLSLLFSFVLFTSLFLEGSLALCLRVLHVWSGGPKFKSSSLPLDGFVFGGPRFNSTLCK